jgi:hypothetical protein
MSDEESAVAAATKADVRLTCDPLCPLCLNLRQ